MATLVETQTVHFRVGEDAGILLMNIAVEHLIYNYNPLQALRTLTESLMGCPTDIAVKILKGDLVLPVDVQTQQVVCQERQKVIHDRFPRIDPMYYLKSRSANIALHGGYLLEGFQALQKQISKNNRILSIDFNYEDLFKFIAGDNEVILDTLRDNQEIDEISSLFEVTKRFIEETLKTKSTMEWIINTFEDCDLITSKNYISEVSDTLADIVYELNKTLKLDFILEMPEDNVQKYIDSAIEIDAIVKQGIVPVDIMSNYSAGWLAPNGDYYGLNGQIANMLHIQISDALLESGVIPEDYSPAVNPDAWLEQQGWVKIHDSNVHFAGCLNSVQGLKNVNITKVQLKKIYEYICLCHGGTMKAGWKMENISAIRFKDWYESDPDTVNEKYFAY